MAAPVSLRLHRAIVAALVVAWLMALDGCGDGSDVPPSSQSTAEQIARIMQTTLNPVTSEQVAAAFALGGNSTDLQRELIKKDLVGSVVEWDIRVYEVSYVDGRYKITSQPISIASADAIQLTRVIALIQAQSNDDDDLLRAIKTDDVLRIRGLVQDIVLRTVVKIGPAVVARGAASSS